MVGNAEASVNTDVTLQSHPSSLLRLPRPRPEVKVPPPEGAVEDPRGRVRFPGLLPADFTLFSELCKLYTKEKHWKGKMRCKAHSLTMGSGETRT